MADSVTKGTRIHYVRPPETGCRPGTLLADSHEEHVVFPTRGLHEFGHLAYGDPPGSESKHTFEVVRRHDPLGAADTWHLATDCPLKSVGRPGAGESRAAAPRADRPKDPWGTQAP